MNDTNSLLHTCACVSLRKTARVVTQFYDKLLQPTGLKVTQYSMLVNIARHKDISISYLGEVMLLDQTTVTRNVNILKNSGYVTIAKNKQDSRTKTISLTDAGHIKLNEATPIWLQIQEKIVNDIGTDKYKVLLDTLNSLQKSIG
ncbi:MarR family winged helix-turn-helix transcriptional regulator [Bacillus sp. EB01]|uniref:MarR family winged helix-turn-helix transcriptional regulator n=1 Tax=Bacillus sp. EB01 TaxID=1347086 RepID=UPI0005C492F5|nr:MarR family winged helix-turn-helix transcriptional regulator [Bacillus sp. EB01]